MDDNELSRQVGTAMREAFPDQADLTLLTAAIRARRPRNAHRIRRTALVASAAACIVLLAVTIAAIKIATSSGVPSVHAAPVETQSSRPHPTAPAVLTTIETLTFQHPASWIAVPHGGPPSPGLADIVEYLTNAPVAKDCRVRGSNHMTPLSCNPPTPSLARDQVLISISAGIYTSDAIKPTRIVRGHRTSIQSGQVNSLPTSATCPTGATNYFQMTIDGRLASDETAQIRRFEFNGYVIIACVNSPAKTIPATFTHMISSVRITH